MVMKMRPAGEIMSEAALAFEREQLGEFLDALTEAKLTQAEVLYIVEYLLACMLVTFGEGEPAALTEQEMERAFRNVRRAVQELLRSPEALRDAKPQGNC